MDALHNSYKGKFTRSWQQLPAEIVKLIATHFLLDVQVNGHCPNTWEARDMWPGRFVYTILRDAIELEKLMCICPTWHNALEHHLFWQQAGAIIDPNDTYAHYAYIRNTPPPSAGSNALASVLKIPPYRHFRNLTSCSCIICRINHPYQNIGLGTAKRVVQVPWLGHVTTCREHRKSTFCGICLREAPPLEAEADYHMVCIVENEDEDHWPGVEATCRSCRYEALARRIQHNPIEREAVGGARMNSPDWETRQSLEAFVELGEGTLSEVITLSREKLWLRKHTKLIELLSQALAASKFASRAENGGEGYGTEDELSEEEDDPEVLSLTEDAGGVRDISITDWARNRILDGFWISPADQWYNYAIPGKPHVVPARHPCPWNRGATYSGALEDSEALNGQTGQELEHPRPKTYQTEIPPSFSLCEQTYRAFQKTMKNILFPAMSNIVRKIVIESTADGIDPAMRAARMTLEDVGQELRDEGIWYNGIDWLERRANRLREEQERERARMRAMGEEDDSSSSSRSDGSHTTSPVLSTTTLQTTPSPPPSGDTAKDEESASGSPLATMAPAIPIPVGPVLKSPQLVHPIPYIPITLSHLPCYSAEAVKLAWREACTPLYQCRCSICERAMLRLNIEAGHVVPSQTQQPTQVQIPPAPPAETTPVPPSQPLLIQILKAKSQDEFDADENLDDEADSIIDVDDYDLGESEKEDAEGEGESEDSSSPTDLSIEAITGAGGGNGRKRPSEEFMDIEHPSPQSQTPEAKQTIKVPPPLPRSQSPPKRAKVDGSHPSSTGTRTVSPSSKVQTHAVPPRLRKRSSEELEGEDEAPGRQSPNGNGDVKRLKSSPVEESRPTIAS